MRVKVTKMIIFTTFYNFQCNPCLEYIFSCFHHYFSKHLNNSLITTDLINHLQQCSPVCVPTYYCEVCQNDEYGAPLVTLNKIVNTITI